MASLDYRLNPLFTIKECSSCGSLYNKGYCCTPDSSQQPLRDCPKCGNPVEGPNCQGCALWRKKLKEVWFILYQFVHGNGIYRPSNTYESSDDDTNVVNAPREPFVVQTRTPKSSQINHNCCYECGDSLDGIFCQRCTCKSCGKGAHIGYNCPPKAPIISNPEPCNQTIDELPQTLPSFDPTIISRISSAITPQYTVNHLIFNAQNELLNSQNEIMEQMTSICDMVGQYMQKKEEDKRIAEDQAAKDRYWKIPICYDDDDDEESSIPLKDIIISGLPPCVAITPVLLTEEPVDSLIMEDEHLDTIPATESDEVIKSSVENLVQIPSESEGIPEKICDMPFRDNSPPFDISKDQFKGLYDSNDDSTSIDDDSFSIDDIDYVEASPPDSELVSLEEVKDFHTEDGEIEDDILHEKLSKINLLIAKIEAINSNPPPSFDFVTKSPSTFLNFFLEETNTFDNSIPESETFCFDLEENSSGSTTTHADFSQYDSFIFDLSINPFPPADRSDFYHEEFAGELAHIISPSEYDHFYFKIEPELGNFTMDVVEDIFDNPTRKPRVHVPNVLPTHPTLHLDSNFTISMIDTLLPFSSKNEDKVVNTGILATEKEQSPHLSSHRGLKALNESPMMIHGENTPNLGVRHPISIPLDHLKYGGSSQAK
ncbi:hypothetical protein Tco_1118094 [Tanacetum coccineum]